VNPLLMVQQGPGAGSTSKTGQSPSGGRLSGGVIATLVGGGLLVVFMAQNTEDVTLQFQFWSFT
jgi:hypothetical protein